MKHQFEKNIIVFVKCRGNKPYRFLNHMKNKKLSNDSINFYRDYGYLYVENLLSEKEILELRKVSDEFLEKSRTASNHSEVFDLEPGHSYESPKLRRLKNPIEQHEVYNRTVRHNKILNIVSQLIGPGIRTFGDKLNMKSASFGSPVQWHQDWAFYPHTNDDLLAVGVCIDDMSIENGALMVIPGSHKGPILNHHQNGRFCGAVTDSNFSDKEAVAIELLAGGITIHHARCLHGSATNTSGAPRRLLLFQYCATDAWPLVPGNNWEVFNKNILRGEASNQPRLEKLTVRLPFPEAEHEGSIYDTQSVLINPFV